MLSIAAMTTGQEQYYATLGREDYYLNGGEPKGHWLGEGAAELGLQGDVKGHDLCALFRGYSPAGVPLVKNAGNEKRQPGWDLTFSVPKSVSVVWSQANDAARAQIQEAVAAAVEKTIGYLEEEATYCRIGRGGRTQVPAKLVVAAYTHSTSRALDPQYHVHCLVLNMGACKDGQWRALVSRPFYEQKMLCGAYFRAALATELEHRLGLKLERPVDRNGNPRAWFELQGVPAKLMQEFSKRRQAIEQELDAHGLESAVAAAFATLGTREAKTLVPPRKELLATWQSEGRKMGFDSQAVQNLLGHAPQRDQAIEYQQTLSRAVQRIAAGQSHFSEQELLRTVFEESQTRGLDPARVRQHVAADLQAAEQFVSLGRQKGHIRYCTPQMLETEGQLLADVDRLHAASSKPLRHTRVEKIIETERFPAAYNTAQKVAAHVGLLGHGMKLNAEQAEALRYLTEAPGRVKVLTGLAGSGKTTLLAAMREAYEREGYRVIGCAVAGVAAKGLQQGTGIESDTLKMRLMQWDRGIADTVAHHAKQLVRAAQGKPTFALDHHTIDAKTVLVVDEAGMVGTREFAQLTKKVADGGGILICVGDAKQLRSIEAGGAFASIAQRVGKAELNQITRQQDAWERDAVKALSRGEAKQVLRGYAERGHLHVAQSREKACEQLIQDWTARGGVQKPAQHVILASTNTEVDYYNDLAQKARGDAGKLSLNRPIRVGNETLFVGDRVLFTQKSRRLCVENGDLGTILRVKGWGAVVSLEVQLDGQKQPVLIPIRRPLAEVYEGLRRGYAFTVHKLQGTTVENAYVHLGGRMMDREMGYVQGSRHRESIALYTDRHEAGIELTNLARSHRQEAPMLEPIKGQDPKLSPVAQQMNKSHAHTLAQDVLDQQPKPTSQIPSQVPSQTPQISR